MVKPQRNKQISDELHRLGEVDKQIRALEDERSRLESQLVDEAGGPKNALQRGQSRRGLISYLYVKFKRQRLAYFVVTSIGVVFLWVGVWNLIEKYSINHWVTAAVGVIIIWLTRNHKQ